MTQPATYTARDRPARSALRYHGGKWNIASWVTASMPPHLLYCEPFGGAASVLLSKVPSSLEVYNDLSLRVVSFFRVLRERPDDLVRALELTPYSRTEFKLAHTRCPDDELEAARRLYVLSWQGRGGPTARWNTGWRYQRNRTRTVTSVEQWGKIEHLLDVARRLKGVQIECADALSVIKRFDTPETLFYCDPPYLFSTRAKWTNKAYDHEMTDEQHRELAAALTSVKGMVLLSGYRADLYDELYAGWLRVDCRTSTDAGGSATESLWLSPACAARQRQLRLYGEE